MIMPNQHLQPPFEITALVLQGGGALGSYQAGVYQGLHEAGISPDWVAGISIGALNAAVIAGNPPNQRLERLQRFWQTICEPALAWPAADWLQDQVLRLAPDARSLFSGFEAWRAVVEGQRAFFVPRGLTPWLGGDQGVARASFYDTTALKRTLEDLVDFDRINDGPMRVSVGAVNVRTGNFQYFDTGPKSTRGGRSQGPSGKARGGSGGTGGLGTGWQRLRAEHFMASGALPPAFAAVEVDGEHYWDGGLVSNTPLAHVLADQPRRDTLAFQVDLWSARGPLPRNVYEAQERMKDIQYSSRTRAVTDTQGEDQQLRRLAHELLALVPADKLKDNPWVERAKALACDRRFSVIQLIYRDKAWEGSAKDYEFSLRTMREHWASGLDDIQKTLAHRAWLKPVPDEQAFVTHDRLRGQTTG